LRSVLIGLVTIISLTITFFIINGFFLSSVAHSKYAYNFFRDIINEEKTYAPMQKNLKEMIKKQQDEKRYIKVTKK
jgi:hypothetical protein